MTRTRKPTTGDVRFALRKRFAAPAWALLEEVRNATGYVRKARMADAIAMSLWPSRGLEVHGVEIKVERSDWIRERDNPEKAEEIAKYCDRWWVAVSDADIVHEGELPPAWGLLVLRGKALVAVREAPLKEAAPLDRAFVASMLRRGAEAATRGITPEEVQERIARELAIEDKDRRAQWEREAQAELVELRLKTRWAEDFEEATGVRVGERWLWGSVRELVTQLKRHDRQGVIENLERRLGCELAALRAGVEGVERARAELEALRAKEAESS
jgi:hypothetical protein